MISYTRRIKKKKKEEEIQKKKKKKFKKRRSMEKEKKELLSEYTEDDILSFETNTRISRLSDKIIENVLNSLDIDHNIILKLSDNSYRVLEALSMSFIKNMVKKSVDNAENDIIDQKNPKKKT